MYVLEMKNVVTAFLLGREEQYEEHPIIIHQ